MRPTRRCAILVRLSATAPMCRHEARIQAPSWLRLPKYGLDSVGVEETDHYRLMREFCADPATFIETILAD